MDAIVSFLIEEFLVVPLLIFMLTGVLVVPFVTPVACIAWIYGALFGKVPLSQTPVSFLLSLFGLGLTVGIWFMDTSFDRIDKVVNNPLPAIGIPCVFMLYALWEQKKAHLVSKWKRIGWASTILASAAPYWMAFSAVMSAAV